MTTTKKYTSGCRALDELLGGGFETGTVIQLFGEGGSGKTNICIQLAVECVKQGEKVVYIDTEGMSPDRFNQIASEDAKKISEKIIMYTPTSFEQQHSSIREIDKIIDQNIGLILLDSATIFYRYELDEERSISLKRELGRQIAHLLELARKNDVAAVITNQVYMDVMSDQLMPTGGSMMEHLSKIIVRLDKLKNSRRKAIIIKHRSMPENTTCEFMLTHDGVKDVEDVDKK